MYIIKDKENSIIAISDDLDYQSNGYPLIHNGMLAIVSDIVSQIEESDILPEGWQYDGNGVYSQIIDESEFLDSLKTPDELRQEGFDNCIEMLMEEGVI